MPSFDFTEPCRWIIERFRLSLHYRQSLSRQVRRGFATICNLRVNVFYLYLRPQDVIVFVVGGATYEEAFTIHELNEDSSFGARIVLGGSTVLSARRYLYPLLFLFSHF